MYLYTCIHLPLIEVYEIILQGSMHGLLECN